MKKTEERKTAEKVVRNISTKDRKKFKTQKEYIGYLQKLLTTAIETNEIALRRLRWSEMSLRKALMISKALEGIPPILKDQLQDIVNNMENFKPKIIIKTVIAKEKYTKDHFNEVDELIHTGYRYEKAYQEVSDKYGFSWESFAKQYRIRHLDKKRKNASAPANL
jgi:hypothetical protein